MKDKKVTVKELIEVLQELPSDATVGVTVDYSNKELIQPFHRLYHTRMRNWVILKGGNGGIL